jgi:transposase-like protein
VTTARAVPLFCPYCGEEQIRPWGDDPDKDHAQWKCEDCLRVFEVRYKGAVSPPTAGHE